MFKAVRIKLARRWIGLVPTEELRDEIFHRAMSDWYKGAVEVMFGLFTQEYPSNPCESSKVELAKGKKHG